MDKYIIFKNVGNKTLSVFVKDPNFTEGIKPDTQKLSFLHINKLLTDDRYHFSKQQMQYLLDLEGTRKKYPKLFQRITRRNVFSIRQIKAMLK